MLRKPSRIYQAILKRLIKKTFSLCQRLGFHVVPNHYYEPVPDTRMLKNDLWSKQSELTGIDINESGQLEILSLFKSGFKVEYDQFPKRRTSISYEYYLDNKSFIGVDAEILYCMVRHFKPGKILEIGSGFSTYIFARAVQKNREEDEQGCELISIDPDPDEVIKAGFPGLSGVICKRVQDVPVSEFEKLKANDILFIDSSHVLKIGSDVQYEFLDIIPRLAKGVIVQVHDIFLPAEYPREWVLNDHKFWTEQYLLQAFMAFNDSFEVLWAGGYMNKSHPGEIEEAFGSYKKGITRPGSFWFRRIR